MGIPGAVYGPYFNSIVPQIAPPEDIGQMLEHNRLINLKVEELRRRIEDLERTNKKYEDYAYFYN